MPKKDTNKTKSYKDKYYLTYNQITKDYDVYILSEDEYNQLSKEQQKEVRYMILIKKSKTNPPEPKGPPAWALAVRNELIAMFKQEITNLKLYVDQKIGEVKQYVNQIVKVNNLKTE